MDFDDSVELDQRTIVQPTSETVTISDKSSLPKNNDNYGRDSQNNSEETEFVGEFVEVYQSRCSSSKEARASEAASRLLDIKVEPSSESVSEPGVVENEPVNVVGAENSFLCKIKKEDNALNCGTSEDTNFNMCTDTGKETDENMGEQVNVDVRNHLMCKLEVEETVLNYDSSEDCSSENETMKETNEANVNVNVKKHLMCILEEGETVLKNFQPKKTITETSMGFPVYVCPYEGCNKEFNRPWRLAEHEHTHTGKRPFVCPEEGCGRTYLRKQHLQRHTQTAHQEAKPQDCFKCDLCNKMMKNRYSFAKHWYRAHVRQNYKCEECGQSFPKQQHLKSHSFVHTGVEPYMCEYPGCGSRFMLPSRLKRHATIHVQNRYACPNGSCGQTFNVYHDLRKHVATSHPKVCDVCGKEFKKLRELKSHRETHNSVHDLFNSLMDSAGLGLPEVSSYADLLNLNTQPESSLPESVDQNPSTDDNLVKPTDSCDTGNPPVLNNHPESSTTEDEVNSNTGGVRNIKEEPADNVDVMVYEGLC